MQHHALTGVLAMMRHVLLLVVLASRWADAGPLLGSIATLREELETNKDAATAACATTESTPRSVTLSLTGDPTAWPHHGRVEITATRDDAFSVCFAREQSQRHRIVGRIDKRIAGTVTLTLSRPAQVLARAVSEAFDDNYQCVPRPGAVPESVVIDIGPDDGVMAVTATTSPSNPAVDVCTAEHIRGQLHDHGVGAGEWKPTTHLTHKLGPIVTTAELRRQVDFLARDAAVSCQPSYDDRPRGKMRVTVIAERDATDFVIAVGSGNEQRDTCTVQQLGESLREYFQRYVDDGNKDYFRIDGDARVTLTFAFESPEKHQARYDAYYRRRYKYSLGE